MDIICEEIKFSLINIYAPNQDSPKFFRDIEADYSTAYENLIIMGDFNLTLNTRMDRENTQNHNIKATEVLSEQISQYMLTDVWRALNDEKKEFSWIKNYVDKDGNKVLKASRIDMALCSPTPFQMSINAFFLAGIKTDHRALLLMLEVNKKERGPGYWKFNSALLNDCEFVNHIEKSLELELAATKEKNSKSRWEIIKDRIQKLSMNYARKKAGENKLIESQLFEIITYMESNLPLNKEDSLILELSKRDLEELLDNKIKGIIFRSKAT